MQWVSYAVVLPSCCKQKESYRPSTFPNFPVPQGRDVTVREHPSESARVMSGTGPCVWYTPPRSHPHALERVVRLGGISGSVLPIDSPDLRCVDQHTPLGIRYCQADHPMAFAMHSPCVPYAQVLTAYAIRFPFAAAGVEAGESRAQGIRHAFAMSLTTQDRGIRHAFAMQWLSEWPSASEDIAVDRGGEPDP